MPPAISFLSAVPQRAKRQILPVVRLPSKFTPPVMRLTQQTPTSEEEVQGCPGCAGAKPSPGNSSAGLLPPSEGGTDHFKF